MKNRLQITVGEAISFLQKCPGDLLIFCSETEYSEEEPHELVYEEKEKPCTVIEVTESGACERYVTFGYASENSNNQSLCTLIYGRFSWLLIVDGLTINFNGRDCAEYFAKHYEELGYNVKWEDENSNSQS